MKLTMTRRVDAVGAWAGMLAVALLVSGCGPKYPLVPVSGKVTFSGGPPPGPGTVSFLPVDGNGAVRPGLASFDATGNLSVQSFRDGDGLLPGRYRMEVHCMSMASGRNSTDGDPHLAAGYIEHVPEDFTAPELVVPAGGSVSCTIDVPLKPGNR